jgi:hypothetical protein
MAWPVKHSSYRVLEAISETYFFKPVLLFEHVCHSTLAAAYQSADSYYHLDLLYADIKADRPVDQANVLCLTMHKTKIFIRVLINRSAHIPNGEVEKWPP